ncbi:MAG: hypothetical protein LUD72_10285 [Bacteroidales bacterium]|nr:hypothetical protein [Bacteroidales bacterium]
MRKFRIDEATKERAMSYIFESVSPKAEQVSIIKAFLDKNFRRQAMDDINADGQPVKIQAVTQVNPSGQPVRDMQMNELLMYLDDQFNKIITDGTDRKKFLKQVITDWFYNKINKNGLLSVNYIN